MPKKSTKQPKSSFAKQFEELEHIVASFDDDDLDLDVSLKQFEKGLQLAEELKKTLSGVENKIETLKQKYDVDPS